MSDSWARHTCKYCGKSIGTHANPNDCRVRVLFAFAKFSPCVNKGVILCEDCDNLKDCDMMQGRVLHQKSFVAGHRYACKTKNFNV